MVIFHNTLVDAGTSNSVEAKVDGWRKVLPNHRLVVVIEQIAAMVLMAATTSMLLAVF